MRHDDDDDDDDDEGDGGDGRWRRRRTRLRRTGRMRRWIVPFRVGGDGAKDDDEMEDDDGVVDAPSPSDERADALGVGASASAAPKSNRGLRRAAEAAERERRTLEPRRRKLGIATGGGEAVAKGKAKRVVAAGHGFGESLRSTHPASGVGCSPRWASRGGLGRGERGTGIAEPIHGRSTRARRVGLGADRR